MNELYAADPAVCCHASDLKLLLASFGPYAGRYLANYPTDWAAQVEKQFSNAGEVETARVQTLLRRARENLTLVTRSNLNWNVQQAWLPNASAMLGGAAAVFDGLIALEAKPPAVQQLHELELPPTAEERIAGVAIEYARISKILLLLSPEVALIDPYLNPLDRLYPPVLAELFKLAAKGKCQKIALWVRADRVFGARNVAVIKADIEDALRRLAKPANFKPGREIEMVMVEDESSQSKLHGRYLLSIKGGIRLDQGFQQLPVGRKVDVGPVGRAIHSDLLDLFFDGKHDMKVAHRLSVRL
ncbi:MAG: hypothetical protein ACOYNF_05665 [Rhodoferax sp.]